jgi:hypothetical protein
MVMMLILIHMQVMINFCVNLTGLKGAQIFAQHYSECFINGVFLQD